LPAAWAVVVVARDLATHFHGITNFSMNVVVTIWARVIAAHRNCSSRRRGSCSAGCGCSCRGCSGSGSGGGGGGSGGGGGGGDDLDTSKAGGVMFFWFIRDIDIDCSDNPTAVAVGKVECHTLIRN